MAKKKVEKRYESGMKSRESENSICCKKALDFLLRNVKSIGDLDLIERAIGDYETELGYDLTKYRKRIEEMRTGY